MKSEKKLISIIDPVGKKAGMDYYDQELLLGLNKIGYKTYLFSNVIKPLKTINNFTYFRKESKYYFIKVLQYFIYHLRSFIKCKFIGSKQIILHIFVTNLATLIVFLFAKFFLFDTIAIVHDVNSFVGEDHNSIRKFFYKYLPNYIVVHNLKSYNELKKIVAKQSLKKVHIIQQGCYPNFIGKFIEKKVAQKHLGLRCDKKYLLFFGQITKIKRLDLLISALGLIDDDVSLLIAGRPRRDDFSNYDKLITRLGLNKRVHSFIRFIEDSEKDYFFYASDIVVLPYDNVFQSAVILLAMTYGKTIIASDIDGFKETITHNFNGLLFKKGDYKSLAENINNVILNENSEIKFSQNMFESLNSKFSWNNIAVLYDKILC